MPLPVSSTCAHHKDVKIALHSLWYHHIYRCDDTRGCVMQFSAPDDEHMCSKHVQAWNKHRCDDTRGCVMQFSAPDDEHMCSKHVQAWNKHSCDDTRGCVMQFSTPDDEHMCSKQVQAWNKLIVKHKFCASSWLITEINGNQVSW